MKEWRIKITNIKKVKQETEYPDVDLDFDGERREDIFHYLQKVYGSDNVAFVGNRIEYKPKTVIRDLGQVYNIPPSESIPITKIYNNRLTVEENCVKDPKIKEFFDKYEVIKDKVDVLVGCGSAGICCAGELASKGVEVSLFESLHSLGGVLVYGIPEFRLPRDILKSEIDYLTKLGVKIFKNTAIGRGFKVNDLLDQGFSAVFLGLGAGLFAFYRGMGSEERAPLTTNTKATQRSAASV